MQVARRSSCTSCGSRRASFQETPRCRASCPCIGRLPETSSARSRKRCRAAGSARNLAVTSVFHWLMTGIEIVDQRQDFGLRLLGLQERHHLVVDGTRLALLVHQIEQRVVFGDRLEPAVRRQDVQPLRERADRSAGSTPSATRSWRHPIARRTRRECLHRS